MSLLDACLVLDEPCDNCDDVVLICVMTVLNCYVFRFVYGTVRGLSLELATILHAGYLKNYKFGNDFYYIK